MLTEEIKLRAIYWGGTVPEDWQIVGVLDNRQNRIWFWKAPDGTYYKTTKKKPWKREYRHEVREQDGITYARKVECGLGRWGTGW